MTAAETYTAQIYDYHAQLTRIHRDRLPLDTWASRVANFRFDPRRELTGVMGALATYVNPDDVVIDVGGGAGQVSLPLALQCRQVINVDPSPGMLREFDDLAQEAGITNVRSVLSDWLASEDVSGDLAVTRNVTYYVSEIVPFVEKMVSAAQRRVMIVVQSVPPPNQTPPIFQLLYDEQQVLVPSYRELLPVLWEMDILPDVYVMSGSPVATSLSREDAVRLAVGGMWPPPQDQDRARSLVEDNFQKLHEESGEGFRPTWRRPSLDMLITWET